MPTLSHVNSRITTVAIIGMHYKSVRDLPAHRSAYWGDGIGRIIVILAWSTSKKHTALHCHFSPWRSSVLTWPLVSSMTTTTIRMFDCTWESSSPDRCLQFHDAGQNEIPHSASAKKSRIRYRCRITPGAPGRSGGSQRHVIHLQFSTISIRKSTAARLRRS